MSALEYKLWMIGIILVAMWAIWVKATYKQTLNKRWTRRWRRVATELGFTNEVDAHGYRRGDRAGLRLTWELPRGGGDSGGTPAQFTIRASHPAIPRSLFIRPYSAASEGWQVGDPAFDVAFSVGGDEAPCRALLDKGARSRLSGLVGTRTYVSGGEVLSRRTGQLTETGMRELAEHALEVLSWLCDQGSADSAERLLALVEGDPEAGVRLACLRALLRACPSSDAAMQAVEVAKKSADHRLLAVALAHSPGPAGKDLLDFLVSAEASNAEKAEALGGVSGLGAEDAVAILQEVLRSSAGPEVIATAVGKVAELGAPELMRDVALHSRRASEAVRAAIVDACAFLGVPACEEVLWSLLDGRGDSSERRALGLLQHLGTRQSLLKLTDYRPHASCEHLAEQLRLALREKYEAQTGGLAVDEERDGRLAVDTDAGLLSEPPVRRADTADE